MYLRRLYLMFCVGLCTTTHSSLRESKRRQIKLSFYKGLNQENKKYRSLEFFGYRNQKDFVSLKVGFRTATRNTLGPASIPSEVNLINPYLALLIIFKYFHKFPLAICSMTIQGRLPTKTPNRAMTLSFSN